MIDPNLKVFMLTSVAFASRRQEFLDFFDRTPEVLNWRASEGAIYLVVRADLMSISNIIRTRFPECHFVLAEISGAKTQGFAPKDTWDFLNYPKALRLE